MRAFQFALDKHGAQLRKSGEPYYTHPVEAAVILADLRMDGCTLAAAVLHDVVEDTDVSVEEVVRAFGPRVGGLVEGVTNVSSMLEQMSGKKIPKDYADRLDQEQILSGLLRDHRIILLKLADRLHNFRTMRGMPAKKAHKKAAETRDVLLPIGELVGVYAIVRELEDWCFRYLHPSLYAELDTALDAEFNAHLPLLETLRQRVLECVQYEPTMGARLLATEVKLCRLSASAVYRQMTEAGVNSLGEVPDRLYLEVILSQDSEKLSIYNDRLARKLCSTVLTEICTQIKAPMQSVLHVADYLDNPQPNGHHCLKSSVLVEPRAFLPASPGGEPDGKALTLGVKVLTRQKYDLEQLGIYLYYRNNTKNMRAMMGTPPWRGDEGLPQAGKGQGAPSPHFDSLVAPLSGS